MPEPTEDLATIQDAQLSVNDSWWEEAADEVEGYDLLRDEALLDLVGVPFKGCRVVYRDGVQRQGVEYRDDYASIELRIAPAKVLLRDIARIQSRRKTFEVPVLTVDQAASLPGQQLVINDGSTGIYRQITQYLVAKGKIVLPEGDQEGEKGHCIYDRPRSLWLAGAEEATAGIDIRLNCQRGLRFSEYPSEYLPPGQLAKTWYIA